MLGTVKPGDMLDKPAVRAAAAIAAAMPADLAARISEIKASSLENLELITRDGITVRFGAWRDVEEKARILSLLLTQMQSKGSRAHFIDISVPDNPVVR
jgi:cell division protein FtsQ